MSAVYERMRAIGAAATSAVDLCRAMGAFGLESDATLGPEAAEQRRAMVAARLPRQQWPDRPMIVAAVNAHTGELAAFDRDSGVDLVDAVTAGTALPDTVPTHNINGTRYINGGVRSAENADLARAMRTSWFSRHLADGPGHYRQASSRVYADHRNGARTWRARSKPCASRAAASW
jgi:NTE family protein